MKANRDPYPDFRCIDFAAEKRKRWLTAERREARGLPGPALVLGLCVAFLAAFVGICVSFWWLILGLPARLIGGM